ALEQVRSPDAELDDLQPTLHVTLGVFERLAVLAGEQTGDLVHVAVHEVDEAHEHAGALLRVGRGPLGLRRLGDVDRGADLVGRGEGNTCLHGSRARFEDVGHATAGRFDVLSAYEMGDHTSHCVTLLCTVFGTVTTIRGTQSNC